MTEYIPHILVALPILIAVGWLCRRWGRADGRAAGYDEGRAAGYDEGRAAGYDEGRLKGLLEAREIAADRGGVTPSLAGGPGAVPR